MIRENAQKILDELPRGVELEAACKTRSCKEILEAIDAGVNIIGENYVQEAEKAFEVIGKRARWHFIGHLQKNKIKKAVWIFDMIETLDSIKLAEELDKGCAASGKVMPVLIEINSGREEQKFGVLPEEVEGLIIKLSGLKYIRIKGLMTMGPLTGNPEDARPYFIETKRVFERMKSLGLPEIEMRYLSMGMSHSYEIAIEEGANIVRIGTRIFGQRLGGS